MTSGERQSLLGLVRQRERVAKADAGEYAATLMVDFESKLAAVCYPSDHPAWKAAHEAQATIAAACRELGIPKAFAPRVSEGWYSRGENASSERRAELRRVAKAEIEARVKKAHAAITRSSVMAQERIITAGSRVRRRDAFAPRSVQSGRPSS
jgi:hypothetical protein